MFMRNDDTLEALNMPTLKNYIGKLATNFFASLSNIDNTEIQFLAQDEYDFTRPKNIRRPRASLALA